MARNDFKSFRTDFETTRVSAGDWRALAGAAVTTAFAVGTAVSALALLEAAFSNPASQVAQRFPSRMESQRWHAGAERAFQLSNLCSRNEPAPCLTD